MKTVKKYLAYYIGKITESFNKKGFVYFLLLVLFGLLVAGAAGFMIWQLFRGIAAFISFVSLNIWTLLGFGVVTVWGVVYIKDIRRERLENKEHQRLVERQLINQESQRTAQDNWTQVRAILYNVLQDVGKLCNIQPPVDLSSLDAPVNFSVQNEVLFFHFSLLKNGDLDVRKAKALIQDRVRQQAYSGQLGIQPSTIIYRGKSFPILMVDKLDDFTTHAQITLAWSSPEYLSGYLSRNTPSGGSISGTNYDDTDF
ncbi:hypothetical protein [Faecalispora jeddahensis]|uniref:hypothetical protein n=1 Tax=Faecalispora jeddahensis TaxID=1414721 RepID=UPI0027B89F78|nr:hypothetical protein [Faecalispora jeddahensis]